MTFMHLYGSTSMYVKKKSSKFHRNKKMKQSFFNIMLVNIMKSNERILKENLQTQYDTVHAMKLKKISVTSCITCKSHILTCSGS